MAALSSEDDRAPVERGALYICPTPLGNLRDMTPRALDALAAADTVCAEDTRVTGKLLAAFGIRARLERLDEASIAAKAAATPRKKSFIRRAGDSFSILSSFQMMYIRMNDGRIAPKIRSVIIFYLPEIQKRTK